LRVLRRDLRHGVVQALVQNLDDLWHLYNIIERDDLVTARTTREVKMDGVGRPSSRRMSVSLTLKVEKVYFDRSVMRLRILGVVTEAREDLHIQGSHHTLNLEPRTQVTIMKSLWQKHQLDRLERAAVRQEPVVIVAIDFEETCVAVLQSYGLEVKALIRSRLPGKREAEKRENAITKYYGEVLDVVSLTVKDSPGKIVIVGPGFAKDRFAVFARERAPDMAKRIVGVKSVSSAGEAGAYEAIRCGVLGAVLRDTRAAQEISAVEEVLRRLGGSKGDVSYGSDEVFRDASEGAVEQILICDLTLREASEENRRLIDEAIRDVENKGGKVLVISYEHEGGAKLNALGGIAALLRYAKHR
jgi:protein pelota